MMSYSPSLKAKAEAELELRRRRRARQVALRALSVADFAARTKIEVPVGANETALYPFALWDAQHDVADAMEHDRLLVILKARQLGITWLACVYALRLCTLWPGQPVLALSRSQDDADEIVHRISLMHREHSDRAQTLPRLVKDNTADLEWDNGSTVVSLAATKNAGRGHTAALVILDEWAFMSWPRATLAAVKPTIDAGGKLWIISSADGLGTEYHQHWLAAEQGANGYRALFLDWTARPDRGADWREQKVHEASGDMTAVLREYPANAIEAFTHAAGLIYDVWTDPGNVTAEADYVAGGGPIFWAVDDGYSAGAAPRSAGIDPTTGQYVGDAHPRVILLVQQRDDGRLCVFVEHYRCLTLSDTQIGEVLQLPYPEPDYAVHGPGAAEIRGRFQAAGLYARQSTANVEESIKELRRALAPDANGWRRVLVHPRCTHLRAEMASYRRDADGRIVKAFDHGPDALRGLVWVMRYEL